MENGDATRGRVPLKQLETFFKIKASNRESLYEKVFGLFSPKTTSSSTTLEEESVWTLPQFDKFIREEMEYEKYILSAHEVEEGVLMCHKCGCKKIVSFSRQVRSGDEPMSVFASCTKCRNQWVE